MVELCLAVGLYTLAPLSFQNPVKRLGKSSSGLEPFSTAPIRFSNWSVWIAGWPKLSHGTCHFCTRYTGVYKNQLCTEIQKTRWNSICLCLWSIWKNQQPPTVFLHDAKNNKYWTTVRHYAHYRSTTNNRLTFFQKVLVFSDGKQSIEPCPIV